ARTRLARKLVDTGNLYVKLRQYDPARVYYRRAIDEYGDTVPSAEAELGLARVAATADSTAAAIAVLTELEQRFPGRPIAARAAADRAKLEGGLAHGRHGRRSEHEAAADGGGRAARSIRRHLRSAAPRAPGSRRVGVRVARARSRVVPAGRPAAAQ